MIGQMFGKTLAIYLAGNFFKVTAGLFVLLLSLIIVVDIIEFSRRVGTISDVRFTEIAYVVLFRAPWIAENILPFAVLFGAATTLIVLNRRLELVVARAAGVSVWQFLLPIAVAAALIGAVSSLAYNPLALAGKILSTAQEADIFSRGPGKATAGAKGVWMRLNQTEGDVVIRAEIGQDKGAQLTNVTAYRFDPSGTIVERIDARSATFVETPSNDNHYVLEELVSTIPGSPGEARSNGLLPVQISKSQLQANQVEADEIGIWQLNQQADRVRQAGKSPLPFLTRFQALLSTPLLFIAMVLVAATISLRFARFGINPKAILAGVLAGFVVYVLSELLITFGSNGLVPPFVAAWSPAIVASLMGITVLLHQEDG
ncbi:MAG: LptF/LptG family permease [Rhizobiaceae bacterium]